MLKTSNEFSCRCARYEGSHMSMLGWLSTLSRKYHIVIGLVLALVVGYTDYVTGYELRMELF